MSDLPAFSTDLSDWRISIPPGATFPEGPWHLSRGDIVLQVVRDPADRTSVALLHEATGVARGEIVRMGRRTELVAAATIRTDPRDRGGPPLHAALAAADFAIGAQAALLVQALDAVAEAWADALGLPASADIRDDDVVDLLEICVMRPQGFGVHQTIPVSFDLGSRARRLAYACDVAEAAIVHAPAESAHQRAERQGNARRLLSALGADPDDLLPKAGPAP